jgi:DNA-binding transcriptional LysR family regulator
MQAQADRVRVEAERLRRGLTGTLKITAPHSVGVTFIAPIVEAFSARHPQVLVEYDGSERRFDVAAGEADIAFRYAYDEPDASLAFDFLDEQPWGVYCSRGFAQRNGTPACLADLGRFPVVALGGVIGNTPQHEGFMRRVDPARISGMAASVPNMRNVLHSGLGVGVLPYIAADLEEGLCLCFGPLPELTSRMWLVTTPEARREPRVAEFVKIATAWFRNRASGGVPA